MILHAIVTRGSSPRARGAEALARYHDWLIRFIPACAGSRRFDERPSYQPPVHPRVRGEQKGGILLKSGDLRFIPACAGSSLAVNKKSPILAVHPRVRGEQ